jgi:hypothetical protein
MTKSIPVFAFAFAAYYTSVRQVRRTPEAERGFSPREPFIETWRTLTGDGALLVKIGVRDDESSAAVGARGRQRPAPPAVKEIWLGAIAETTRGFSGAVCMSQEPLRHVRMGQRIRFDPTCILDWTISYGGPSAEPEHACGLGEACECAKF